MDDATTKFEKQSFKRNLIELAYKLLIQSKSISIHARTKSKGEQKENEP